MRDVRFGTKFGAPPPLQDTLWESVNDQVCGCGQRGVGRRGVFDFKLWFLFQIGKVEVRDGRRGNAHTHTLTQKVLGA